MATAKTATTEKSKGAALPATIPEMTGYDANINLFASRYKQGGRTVYGVDLSLPQIRGIVPVPDPKQPTPGNRAIRENHAIGFGKYLRTHEHWVVPAMILRGRPVFKFEVLYEVDGAEFGTLSFPRFSQGDIHILDGQHRILGIDYAFRSIDVDLDKARSDLALARKNEGANSAGAKHFGKIVSELETQKARLERERISVQFFVEEDMTAYKQMFFDIADNALGITSSVKARFDSRKVVNRALNIVTDHPLLVGRVDPERDRVSHSPYLVSAKHVAEIVRITTVGIEGRVSKLQEAALDERAVARVANDYLDTLVDGFYVIRQVREGALTPDGLRKESLLGSVLMLRILAGVYFDLVHEREWTRDDMVNFWHKIEPHMSGQTYEGSIWTEHTDAFDDHAFGPRGRRQDIKALTDHLVEWALLKPEWLNEAPAPRPEPWVDPELNIGYTKYGADIPA